LLLLFQPILRVTAFGIDPNVFPMGLGSDAWSAVGLTISLAIGYDNFEELLANEMDEHFKPLILKTICQ
jgi:glucose-6-phosphate isomerase